jgi:hypothetical protein
MRKVFAALAMVLCFTFIAAAQDIPRMETFLGFTFVRWSSGTNAPSFNSYGGSGQFVYNIGKHLSAVADLGAVHNGYMNDLPIDNTVSSFLFGPRLTLNYGPRMRPYIQVLWGVAHLASSTRFDALVLASYRYLNITDPLPPGLPVNVRLSANDTAFAMTVGGGLDFRINRHVSLRPVAMDYYLTRFQNFRTLGDDSQGNLRITTGVNFTFGAQ